jgi:hypothetical protein
VAKIKKRRLRWSPSISPTIIGYKLYWAEEGGVGYHSGCAFVGNVAELILPEQVPSFPLVGGPIELGITAVNEIGNESDMVTFTVPFQFSVPDPPSNLCMEATADYHVTTSRDTDQGQNTLERIRTDQAEDESLPSASVG